ncbi:MAG: phage tail tape measure protein [Planctomycetota bacterium]
MNRSLAIMGDVTDVMRKDMRAAAIEVARTTNASSREAAQGYFFLASAGLDAAASLKALPRVAEFAQAGNFELALATDLLTDAQSALGLSVDNASKNLGNMTRVSDALVKANTLANASVQQFTEALTNKAGAALRQANKELEEGLAVLAVFADQGIKGAEAGTALGIVMRDLQTKALMNAGEFRRAGVAVFDFAGRMRNLGRIVGDLEAALDGLSVAQQKTTLLQLGFTDKSVSFVQSLLGSADAIAGYETALRSAGNTTAEVAAKQLTPYEKATNRLDAAVDRLATGLGDYVAPRFDELAAAIGYAADQLSRLNSESVKSQSLGEAFVKGEEVGYVLNHLGKGFGALQRDIIRGVGEAAGFIDRQARKLENAEGMLNKVDSLFGLLGKGTAGTAIADEVRGIRQVLTAVEQTFLNSLKQPGPIGVGVGSGADAGKPSGPTGSLLSRLAVRFGEDAGLNDLAKEMRETVDRYIQGTRSIIDNPANQLLLRIAPTLLGASLKRAQAGIDRRESVIRQGQEAGVLRLTQTGSEESFRQNASIRRQFNVRKIDRQKLRELRRIERNTRGGGLQLALANL